MEPLSPDFGRIYEGLHQSKMLEKKAELSSPEEAVKVLREKAANDYTTFELAKTAALGQTLMGGAKRFAGSSFGKGLGFAAGAAIPAVAAGNMISNHAAEQARNKALETGVGLAGIGSTLYGLHRLTQPKTAADLETETKDVEDALKKLASIGYIDELIDAALHDPGATEGAKKLATEMKYLNREYGVSILSEIVG